MKTFGNVIWLIFGGLLTAISYFLTGAIFCITIVLIPIGFKYMKLAGLVLWPFGRTVDGCFEDHPRANAFWLACGGISCWLFHCIIGLLLCVTIIGIPFAKQNFKIAKYVLRPFGGSIDDEF